MLAALVDDDWAAAVLDVSWQKMPRASAKESNNAFRKACFLSRVLDLAHSLDSFGAWATCSSIEAA